MNFRLFVVIHRFCKMKFLICQLRIDNDRYDSNVFMIEITNYDF
jgi:hypothetical protein